MPRTIALDFETYFNSKEGVSLKVTGQRKYVRDPRTDPYLVSLSDGSETWAGHPRDCNFDALNGQILVSHNAGFDSSVAREKAATGVLPVIKPAAWHCTANMSMFMCMRRDLARASEFLLGATVDKSYREDADGLTGEQIIAAGKYDKVKTAGRADAFSCWQLWAKYGHLWPQSEREISDLTIRQCHRGVQMNVTLLKEYLFTAQTMLIQAESNLPWMKQGKKPTSPKAIAEECRKHGIPCPPVKAHEGEEAYEEWAAAYGPRFSWVKAYTDYRVINKFIATLEKLQERTDENGIFYFDLLYFGAHTGRWAGSGGFNMQNMRKDPLFCDSEGWLITDGPRLDEIAIAAAKQAPLPPYVKYILDIRALFIARPGRKLILSDLSQIEPRVLAWMIGDRAMLDGMARGESPYVSHARATMNWTGGDMKKEDKHGYALAKARVLGLGFGCGWNKFITVAMTLAGLDITVDDPEEVPLLNSEGLPTYNRDGSPKMTSGYGFTSKKIVAEYRAQNPLVVGLWKTLDDALRASEGKDFSITLPSGRTLRYPDVRREMKMVVDPEKPGKFKRKMEFTAWAFDQKRNSVVRKPFYGGVLTENAVQATARDVFAGHLLVLDKTPGVDTLWSVHDEAINEVDQNITKRDIEHIMSQSPSWLPGCPISAEAVETPCYLK